MAREVQRFAELVATLRRECPWDREQTHESLRRHLLEESYEVLDALDHVDPETGEGYDHLEEELGDLLFQIVFHATLAAEAGQFTLADVARTRARQAPVPPSPRVRRRDGGRRRPGGGQLGGPQAAGRRAAPRSSTGIPEALPALLLALKVQRKAAGLDVPAPGRRPAAADLPALAARRWTSPDEDALGDLLYAVVGWRPAPASTPRRRCAP